MFTKKVKVRMATFFVCLGVAIFLIIVRLFHVQIIQHDTLTKRANRQHQRVGYLQPKRGAIYDRKKRELAVSVNMSSVYANPKNIKNPMETALTLKEILDIDDKKILDLLTGGKSFVWIKRRVNHERAKKIKDLNIPGIELIQETRRFYPKKELAAHILGFVGLDDQGLENKGLEGIEYYYDQYIKGTPGWIVSERDAIGRNISSPMEHIIPSTEGKSIILTIDEVVQHIAERELKKGAERFSAKNGMAIVIDPKTFEILAMANWPFYNPNKFANYSQSVRRNRVITDLFEPGSTFKVAIMSGLLEDEVVRPEDEIYCEKGAYLVHNHFVRDSHPFETLTFKEAVEVSSNIAFIKLSEKWSPRRLYQYLCSFGFGVKTGIGLPGEVSGIIPRPDSWSKLSIGAIPIGQEVGVTGIQLIQSLATIANKGILMQPYIVKSIVSKNGTVKEFRPRPLRRVISEDTAREVTEILKGVVKHGTGKRAYLPGYQVCGKTGTAMKFDTEINKYSSEKIIVSFFAFAPAKDPRVCVLVVLDEPKEKENIEVWGATMAAPIVKEIMRETLRYYNVPQEREEEVRLAKETVMPDLKGLDLDSASRVLARAGLGLVKEGEGRVVTQQVPMAGVDVKINSKVKLYFQQKELIKEEAKEMVMPDLLGLTMRQALLSISPFQLNLRFEGSGLVVKQFPLPGSQIKRSQKGVVYFSGKS